MIDKNSPLRQLPAALDRKQSLYLDGIRHAAEIADLAYSRLCKTLSHIARQEEVEPYFISASAFADAWTVVDAIHRYNGLQRLIPGFEEMCGPPTQGDLQHRALLSAAKDVRDLGDHVASRVDQILAERVPILGALSWFTVDPNLEGGRSCLLAPGTLHGSMSFSAVNPTVESIDLRHDTGLVHLATAVGRLSLSDLY